MAFSIPTLCKTGKGWATHGMGSVKRQKGRATRPDGRPRCKLAEMEQHNVAGLFQSRESQMLAILGPGERNYPVREMGDLLWRSARNWLVPNVCREAPREH